MRGNLIYFVDEGKKKITFEQDENGEYEVVDGGRITQHQKTKLEERYQEFIKAKNLLQVKQSQPEDNPEYVITAFRNKASKDVWKLDVDRYKNSEYSGVWYFNELHNHSDFEIFSVKRTNDSLIFEVDEIVSVDMCMPTDVKIKSFQEHSKNMGGVVLGGAQIATFPNRKTILVTIQQYGIDRELQLDLSQLTKKKEREVLFITDDGVPIYDCDIFWGVYNSWILVRVAGAQQDSEKRFIKTFAEKEKAEEYILFNKPTLPPYEVINLINGWANDDSEVNNLIDNIIALAKEKIK